MSSYSWMVNEFAHNLLKPLCNPFDILEKEQHPTLRIIKVTTVEKRQSNNCKYYDKVQPSEYINMHKKVQPFIFR